MSVSTFEACNPIIKQIFSRHPRGAPELVISQDNPVGGETTLFFDTTEWKMYISPEDLRIVVILHESAHGWTWELSEDIFISKYIELLDRYLHI